MQKMPAFTFGDIYWFGTACCERMMAMFLYEQQPIEIARCHGCEKPFMVFQKGAPLPKTQKWDGVTYEVEEKGHPKHGDTETGIYEEIRLARIEVCVGRRYQILTPRFYGETKTSVQAELLRALKEKKIVPKPLNVSFCLDGSLLEGMAMTNTDDAPGKPFVTIDCQLRCINLFYLPRDNRTRKFVDIDKQVQSLGVLQDKRSQS